MNNKLSEEQLVAGLQTGSPEAYRQLYEEHAPAIVTLLERFYKLNPDDAEDLTHDAFEALLKGIALDPARFITAGDVKSYLYIAVRNLVYKKWNKDIIQHNHAGALTRQTQAEQATDFNKYVQQMETYRQIVTVINAAMQQHLTEKEQMIIQLFREGKTLSEIAIILDIPYGTVRNKKSEALKKLAKELKPYEPLFKAAAGLLTVAALLWQFLKSYL